jgi:mRNA interferase MazF
MIVKRGDIFYINIPKVENDPHKQGGCRPCVIVSNDTNNKHCSRIHFVPLTSKLTKNNIPTHIPIKNTELQKESIALCECVDSVDKSFLKEKIGRMSIIDMDRIDDGITIQLLPKKCLRFFVDNNSQFAIA